MKNLTEQMHERLVADGWENRGKNSGSYRKFIDDQNWLSIGLNTAKLRSPKFKGRPNTHEFGVGISHQCVHALFDKLFYEQGFAGFIGCDLRKFGFERSYADIGIESYRYQEVTLEELLEIIASCHEQLRPYAGPSGLRRGLQALVESPDQFRFKMLTLDVYDRAWGPHSEQMLTELQEFVPPGGDRLPAFEANVREHLAAQ